MWMINDFPAYSIMSDWNTSGYLAYPSYAKNTYLDGCINQRKYAIWDMNCSVRILGG